MLVSRRVDVYTIFAVSGAAALIYQILWARWLGLVFGNTATSISIVLGAFMIGLALGSWAAGRLLHRIADPMIAYVCAELGIGVFAVAFPVLSRLFDGVFSLLVSAETSPVLTMLAKSVLALGLLVVPTSLMGATLPFLTEFFRRSPSQGMVWSVGVLYAANTLGAAFGVLVSSYLLIETLGVRGTTLVAALGNFLVALVGYRTSRRARLEAVSNDPSTLVLVTKNGRLATAVLAATGGVGIASEVLWTRTLDTIVGNSTYAFALILVVYLVGIATGSWIMSLWVRRARGLTSWLAALPLGMGVWTIIAIRRFSVLAHGLAGLSSTQASLGSLLATNLEVALLLTPLAMLSGAVFPVATRILDPEHEDAAGTLIARAFAWNTLGAVVGSFIAGFAVAACFEFLASLYVLATAYGLISVVAAAVVLMVGGGITRSSRAAFILGSAAVVLVAIGSLRASDESPFVRGFDNGPIEVVYHRPGVHGVTSVLRLRGEALARSLLVNGHGMTVKITDTKMMAHLPMLFHPAPRDSLIVCFGMGTTYRSAISHGGRVSVVELVPEVFDTFDLFFADTERVRSYPNGRMIVNDGRNFLKLTDRRFDVISIDPPPPIDGAGVNNLYSKEFLELAQSRLQPGGIVAHWIPYPGSEAGVDDVGTFEMLVRTFAEVFPNSVGLPGFHGVGLHVLGSDRDLALSPQALASRLDDPAVAADVFEWDAVPLDYFASYRSLHALVPGEGPIVTDDRPLLEFYLLRAWTAGISKTRPSVYWRHSGS